MDLLSASLRCRIWSVISEMRGEITRVQPGISNAGSWYVNDLPPPLRKQEWLLRQPEPQTIEPQTCWHHANDVATIHVGIANPRPLQQRTTSNDGHIAHPCWQSRKLVIPNTFFIVPFN